MGQSAMGNNLPTRLGTDGLEGVGTVPAGSLRFLMGVSGFVGIWSHMCLNTWFPAGGSVWEGCGTFRRPSLTGGRGSLG